jgi:hypothetical protein
MRSTVAGCALVLALTGCCEDPLEQGARLTVAPMADASLPNPQPTSAGSYARVPNDSVTAPGAGAPVPDWCKEPLTVERLCSRPDAPCPGSAREVRMQACANSSIWGSTIPNGCGGTSVITRLGGSGRTWDFDKAGKLVALTSYNDALFGPCQLNYYVWGEPCGLGLAQEDLCAADPDAGAEDAG